MPCSSPPSSSKKVALLLPTSSILSSAKIDPNYCATTGFTKLAANFARALASVTS